MLTSVHVRFFFIMWHFSLRPHR